MVHSRLPGIMLNRDKLNVAIRRKLAGQPITSFSSTEIEFWKEAYEEFIKLLREGRFGAVVCDYDGTLCGMGQRYSAPPDEIVRELCRLLRGGVIIGIATGRGKSVRDALSRIIPKRLQSSVMIGYYSGSDIAPLSDLTRPDTNLTISPWIEAATQRLLPYKGIFFEWAISANQMTLTPVGSYDKIFVQSLVANILMSGSNDGMRVLSSLDSIDVLTAKASKLAVVAWCKELSHQKDVLCIGDQGGYPGNDFELLTHSHSLSVDVVSPDPRSCWNLSARGIRGVQATVEYLQHLTIRDGTAILEV